MTSFFHLDETPEIKARWAGQRGISSDSPCEGSMDTVLDA